MPWELRRNKIHQTDREDIWRGRAGIQNASPGYAGQRKEGQDEVTDAFSIPYTTEHLIKEGGKATRELGERALLEWGETEYFGPFGVK